MCSISKFCCLGRNLGPRASGCLGSLKFLSLLGSSCLKTLITFGVSSFSAAREDKLRAGTMHIGFQCLLNEYTDDTDLQYYDFGDPALSPRGPASLCYSYVLLPFSVSAHSGPSPPRWYHVLGLPSDHVLRSVS